MSDMVVGIAVLDRRKMEDTPEELHILCQCADGNRRHTSIPVYPKGGQKTREHQWEYTIRDNMLDVKPSVNWIGVFHNDGAWSIEFRDFTEGEYDRPGDLFRALNGIQQ
jgi:hypothetical protein